MRKFILGGIVTSFLLIAAPVFASAMYSQVDNSGELSLSDFGGRQVIASTTISVSGQDFTNTHAYFSFKNPSDWCNFGHYTDGTWSPWYFSLRKQDEPTTYAVTWFFSAGSTGWEDFDFAFPTSYSGATLNSMPSGTYSLFFYPNCNNGNVDLKFKADSSNSNVFGFISNEEAPYYAKIKNTGGYLNLRNGTSTSSGVIKTLPEDWIVQVSSTTNALGGSIINNGYRWYRVIDPTDGISGWMAGGDASSTVQYLPFQLSKQTEFGNSSNGYVATSSRSDLILNIVDHYYNDMSTSSSLYSSDNGSNHISTIKDQNFEKKVIWGIAAQESGGISFNNEYVSSDYGHGIMQITFSPGSWDNRGVGSDVTIPPCEAVSSSDYLNCYGGTSPKYYQPYGGSGSDVYKQYTNTEQSIYANLKDGLEVLADKLSIYSSISATTTVNGTTYSPVERKIISATESYNGACAYVDDVADRLDQIGTYFSNATSSDITTLVQKMHTAGNEAVCAQLHSPGDLSIQDSKKQTVGVVSGREVDDFPLAVNDRDHKLIKILSPENGVNYVYKVAGTDSGTYGLDVTIKNGKEFTKFRATDIAILPNEVHTYSIDREAVLKGENGVTLEIDRNGDGVPERNIKTGLNLTGEAYNNGATQAELQAFAKGDKPQKFLTPLQKMGPEILLPYPKTFIPPKKIYPVELKMPLDGNVELAPVNQVIND